MDRIGMGTSMDRMERILNKKRGGARKWERGKKKVKNIDGRDDGYG